LSPVTRPGRFRCSSPAPANSTEQKENFIQDISTYFIRIEELERGRRRAVHLVRGVNITMTAPLSVDCGRSFGTVRIAPRLRRAWCPMPQVLVSKLLGAFLQSYLASSELFGTQRASTQSAGTPGCDWSIEPSGRVRYH
jgi:hypothetical protein